MGKQIGEVFVKVGADTQGLESGLNKAKGTVEDFGTKSKETSEKVVASNKNSADSFIELGKQVIVAVAAFKSLSVIIESSGTFQSLEKQLNVATGSTEKAKAAMSALTEISKMMPESVENVTSAFIKMKNLGLEPTANALLSFSNTAAANGKDIMQFVEAVADAATGEFERLKEFGIKTSVEGDKVTMNFKGQSTEIQNTADSITAYLQNIGNTDFAGAATEQMDTINGVLSNTDANFQILAASIGDASGINSVFTSTMKTLNTVMEHTSSALNKSSGDIDKSADSFKGLEIAAKATVSVVQGVASGLEVVSSVIGLFGASVAALTDDSISLKDVWAAYNDQVVDSFDKVVAFNKELYNPEAKATLEETAAVLDAIAVSTTKTTNSLSKQELKQMQKLQDLELELAYRQELAKFDYEGRQEDAQAQDQVNTQDKLDALMEQYASESDLLRSKYEEEQLIIDEAYLNQQLSAEKHGELMAEIQDKYAKARTKLDKKEGDVKFKQLGGILDSISSLMNSKNREMFEIGKVAATANAVVNTYQGATKALAEVPYPWNFAAAASVVASGMAQVSSIQSTSFGSGGASGGAGVAAGAPAIDSGAVGQSAASSPAGGTLTVQGLSPTALFSGEAVSLLAEELLEYERNGGNVVLRG